MIGGLLAGIVLGLGILYALYEYELLGNKKLKMSTITSTSAGRASSGTYVVPNGSSTGVTYNNILSGINRWGTTGGTSYPSPGSGYYRTMPEKTRDDWWREFNAARLNRKRLDLILKLFKEDKITMDECVDLIKTDKQFV